MFSRLIHYLLDNTLIQFLAIMKSAAITTRVLFDALILSLWNIVPLYRQLTSHFCFFVFYLLLNNFILTKGIHQFCPDFLYKIKYLSKIKFIFLIYLFVY